MRTRFLVAVLVTLNACCLLAQSATSVDATAPVISKVTFYYTLNWELTSPEKSVFRREAGFDLGEMVFEGIYKDYNKDNRLIAEGLYAHGEKRGLQNEYFSDRSLKSTIELGDHEFTIWELRDENKEIRIKGGTGTFTHYYLYLSGLVSQPTWKSGIVNGEFNMGRRAGTWTYDDTNKVRTDEEIYENGKLVKRIHYSDGVPEELDYPKEVIISVNGLYVDSYLVDHTTYNSVREAMEKLLTYPAGFNRDIAFPGGIKKLLLLLQDNAAIPTGNVALVRIKMDETGKVIKYKVENVDDPGMKDRALKAVKLYENRLFPAIRDGRPHSSTMYLPISGGQEWTETLNRASSEELVQSDTNPSKALNVLGVVLGLLLLGLSLL